VKLIGLKEAKAHLSEFVDVAQRDRVLITRRGQPAALVIGVEGQDLEQIILGSSLEFWKMIDQRRNKKSPTLTSDEIRRSFGLDSSSAEPGTARSKKSKVRRRPG
jgi:prevent-host-death family protein